MPVSRFRTGRIGRWVACWLLAAISIPLLAITFLGSQVHRIIARSAGAVIGEIEDNLGVVVAISVFCVAGVWLFILAKCWAERRQETRDVSREQSSE